MMLKVSKRAVPPNSMVEIYFENGKPWDRKPVLVINYNEKFFALEPFCTHEELSLEDGFISDDGKIVCPWHGSVFDIQSGKVIDGPAKKDLKVYKVIDKGTEVEIIE